MPTWMERLFGIEPEEPIRRTEDIELPYQGPWEHVDPALRKLIWRAAETHDLPPDRLFSQIDAESSFQPTAGNPSGAQGLMQLMPLMRKHYGVVDATDPESNINAGARYMRELLDKYDQNYELALAAYNAGPTAVRKAKGVPKYKETQEYIKKVMSGRE